MHPAATDKHIRKRLARALASPLPWFAELAYFGIVFYGNLAPAYEISISMLAAAGLALLALYCVIRLRGPLNPIYSPIKIPLACALSFILIQVIAHNNSLLGDDHRQLVNWIMALIVLRSLSVRGEEFFHRAAIAMLIVGLFALPFLEAGYGEYRSDLERTGLSVAIPLANPNDLAAWFGFCCLYFIILGLEAKNKFLQLAGFGAATGCLFVVGLTVSRSVLGAIALGAILASRRVLRGGFMPLLIIVVVLFTALQLGLFDQAVSYYLERGAEETGRLQMWPLAIDRFLGAPFVGVGVEDIGTYIPESGRDVTPHNSFLYIGLASGILPLVLFCLFWVKAMQGAFRLSQIRSQLAPFQLPLMLYTTLIALTNAGVFMVPWACLVMTSTMSKGESSRATVIAQILQSRLLPSRKQSEKRYAESPKLAGIRTKRGR
jgi:hypothetical protein